MTKQRQSQPVHGWMASSQDTLVPYPLPGDSIPALPRKHRGRRGRRGEKPLPEDTPSGMATALSPRSVPNRLASRPHPSPSVASPHSVPARLSPRAVAAASQQLQDLTHRKFEERRRPRHIVFFRNGDSFFKGKKMLITPHRYTSFEDLLSELTRNMKLPYGVRQIFHPDGSKISEIEDLQDGESYVCASFERLKRMKYGSSNGVPLWNGGTRRNEKNDESYLYAHVPVRFSYPVSGKYADNYKSTFGSGHSGPGSFAYNRSHPGAGLGADSNAFGILHTDHSPIKPKVVKIVKTGTKPRKVVSLLINKRSVQSYEQLIQDVSDAFSLPKYKNNRIRKLYTLRGKEVKSLADFYRDKEGVLVASSSRTAIAEDTFVDIYEELFPDSPHEQFFSKKKSKKKDRTQHDSGISDDEDKVQKKRRDRSKPKRGDSRLEDSRGINELDAGSEQRFDKDATENKEPEEEHERKNQELEERVQEKLKKRESELLQKEEELRLKEEELKKKEVSENERKDRERQEELAKKEAEIKEREEKLKMREEEERQKAARREEAERDRREEEEAALKELQEKEQIAAEEQEEQNAEAEKRVRGEKDKEGIEEEQHATEADVVNSVAGEESLSRASLGQEMEPLDESDPSVQYREDEGDLEDGERLAQLEADLQQEAERREKERESISSPSGGSDEILYRESEDDSFSPVEQKVEFVREPRTLVKKSEILVKYEIGAKIGDGNFADVHEATRRGTEELFAMKVIEKAKLKNKEHMVENEIAIMKHVRHPNIVRLYEEFETRGHIYLVMEFVPGGDLFDAITDSVKFTEADAAAMVKDLASALNYLHNLNVVHRDLKPENLLVNTSDSGEIMLKLADFGLAMEVKEPIYTVCGTPTYVAPEILAETGYGLEVDIWALGVISYILLCGFPPFRSPDRDQEELFELIQAGHFTYVAPYWDTISTAAKDLIDHLLVVDRQRRFTAGQVLGHPWVAGGGSTEGALPNLQREVSMNLEKNFEGRRSAAGSARRTVRRKGDAAAPGK